MSNERNRRPAHLELLGIAWNFGWPIASGVLLGFWLDERLGTSPGLTLGFGIGAMGAAVHRLIDLSKREVAERAEAERAETEAARRDSSPEPSPEDPKDEDGGAGERGNPE